MQVEVVHSETAFRGRVFDVRQDQVRLPDERQVQYDVVEHNGSVTLIPLDENGEIWFVRQYRHPAAGELLELPAGVMNDNEDAEATAKREIREEIGMAARKLEPVGEFYLAPGYSTEYMVVFLATDLYPSPLQQDEDELLVVEKIHAAQALKMAETGQFRDVKTLAALLLARPRLKAM
jgi:ADP-ribose pyrophosphatase